MSETERVVSIIGGGRALGRSIPRIEFDLIALVRRGVPYRALESAKAALEVSNDDLARNTLDAKGEERARRVCPPTSLDDRA